jgi:prepilin-type processing-associated H-X9-DG protein
LVANNDWPILGSPRIPSWAYGLINWGSTPDNTNTQCLTDSRNALLGSYTANAVKIYVCPTDSYLSPVQKQRGWINRIRSVSMNAAVGEGAKFDFGWGPFFAAKKSTDLTLPGPSQSWVFTDEHPDSIDDTILYINPASTNGTGVFTELPSSDHNGACGLAFADGHSEIHKWRDPQTVRPVTYILLDRVNVTADQDLAWLSQRTPH